MLNVQHSVLKRFGIALHEVHRESDVLKWLKRIWDMNKREASFSLKATLILQLIFQYAVYNDNFKM